VVGYRWYADDHVGNVNNTEIYTLTTVDNIIPSVTIITPLNQTYSTTTILFNITAADVGSDVDSCWYSLDAGATNVTMTETYAPYWNATNSSMTQGSHTSNYYCNDTFGNLNDTEQVTFFIDTIYPLISIDYPANTTYTVNVSDLNFTYTEANPDKCWYSKDGGSTNLSVQECTSNFSNVVSVEGNNTWIVYINDTVGHENSSSVTFTKDTVYPLIDYAANSDPYNTSGNFTIQDWVFVNVTVTEANEANITFILWTLYGTHNETTYNTSIRTINWTGLPESMYFWNVTVCDIVSQCNTTEIRQYGVEIINVSIEGYFTDLDIELGTSLTINATNTNDTICVSIDHPDYGTNYSCDSQINVFELVIDYFRKTTFNDSASSKVYNFTGSEIYNFSIDSHQYDEIDALSFNISGVDSPTDLTFYKANTSFLLSNADRFFHGILEGANIYLNKFFDESTTANITYSNPGEAFVYFYLDDAATLIDFLINVTGTEYGFVYEDLFDNYDYIDTSETTAQLDLSGVIMAKNSDLTEFSFDDFEDDSIASHWIHGDDFSVTTPCTLKRTTSETGGYLKQDNYLYDVGANCQGNSLMYIRPNSTNLNLYTSENIAFNLSSTYDSTVSRDCHGLAYVDLGGALNNIWTSSYLGDNDDGVNKQDETSDADMAFTFSKHNKTHWRVEISGLETSTAYRSDSYNYGNGVWNWTAGTYSVTWSDGPDYSGDLDNDFFMEINYSSGLPITIRNSIDFGTYCKRNRVITKTYHVNNSLWSRSNGTVVSESVFDSASNIASATLTAYGYNEPGEDFHGYLSADAGENWESVTSGVLHTFSNPGKHIKWMIDFNLTNTGYLNTTSRISNISIITPPSNVSNITFDFGANGGVDYTIEGELNLTNSPYQINISNVNLANVFTSARRVFGNTYKIPLAIETDSAGGINLDTINLTYDPNPVVLDAGYIQDYISILETDFSISFNSTGGNITIDNVKYDYEGGNKTYIVTAHNDDYSINTTRNLTYYYSSFYKNLPYTWMDYILFLPRTNSSKNVTPHGQTSTTPLFNITSTGYGGVNINLSIRVNESFSCLNLTWNATGSTKPADQKINTSWQEISSDVRYLNNTFVWFWADLENCNVSDQRILSPWLDVGSYCKSCLWSGS